MSVFFFFFFNSTGTMSYRRKLFFLSFTLDIFDHFFSLVVIESWKCPYLLQFFGHDMKTPNQIYLFLFGFWIFFSIKSYNFEVSALLKFCSPLQMALVAYFDPLKPDLAVEMLPKPFSGEILLVKLQNNQLPFTRVLMVVKAASSVWHMNAQWLHCDNSKTFDGGTLPHAVPPF